MGFWNFFRNKKNEDSDEIESPISKDDTNDLIFAKNFTSFGGRFTFIDEKNSTNEIFQKIIEENQWSNDNVCSLDSNISKNLNIRLIRKIDNDNVKALVTECEPNARTALARFCTMKSPKRHAAAHANAVNSGASE